MLTSIELSTFLQFTEKRDFLYEQISLIDNDVLLRYFARDCLLRALLSSLGLKQEVVDICNTSVQLAYSNCVDPSNIHLIVEHRQAIEAGQRRLVLSEANVQMATSQSSYVQKDPTEIFLLLAFWVVSYSVIDAALGVVLPMTELRGMLALLATQHISGLASERTSERSICGELPDEFYLNKIRELQWMEHRLEYLCKVWQAYNHRSLEVLFSGVCSILEPEEARLDAAL